MRLGGKQTNLISIQHKYFRTWMYAPIMKINLCFWKVPVLLSSFIFFLCIAR